MQRIAIGVAVIVLAIGVTACARAGSGAPASPAITGAPAATASAVPTPKPTPAPSPPASPAGEVTGDLVDVVEVTCGDGAPALSSGRVRASEDGLTIDVTGTAGWYLSIDTGERGEGAQLGRDRERLTFRLPPGDLAVSCTDPAAADAPTTALRLEDPDGWYRSPEVNPVSGSCMSGEGSFTADARGSKGDPVELAKAELKGLLLPGDVVERAGYPADTGLVRVVRDGRVLGVLRYVQDPDGGWLQEGTTMCAGLQGGPE